jgi:hypothetical protein
MTGDKGQHLRAKGLENRHGKAPVCRMRESVDRPDRAGDGEQKDEALNLPPTAKTESIPQIATALGKGSGFETRITAKSGNQIGGIIKCCAIMNIKG